MVMIWLLFVFVEIAQTCDVGMRMRMHCLAARIHAGPSLVLNCDVGCVLSNVTC
jgi:hypothetical protein